MAYLRRTIDSELDALLPLAPAIALDGPKGAGKTDTASRRAGTVWRLDDQGHRDLISADPALADAGDGTILLDEWQRLPAVWDMVRRSVDGGAPAGRFLLTGSATPRAGTHSHSGAGRILPLRMRPMGLHERGVVEPAISVADLLSSGARIEGTSDFTLVNYAEQIVASGFPGINRLPAGLRRRQLDGYLQRIVDRDLPDHGVSVRRPESLRRWLAAYAAATSSTAAYNKLLDATTAGDGSQPAKTTTIAYRDHLTQLWLLDPVAGWSPSRRPLARLQQAPKHHLADPALAARLLNLTEGTLLTPAGAALIGPLFESLVTLTVRVCAQAAEARVGHLRTTNGDHEVDLVVEGIDGQVLGLEVKLAPHVDDADVRHLHWLRRQLGSDVVDLAVITTGTRAYRRADGVAVIPLALLGA